MILECDTRMFNPSNVDLISLGDVFCSLYYLDEKHASSNIDIFSTEPIATVIMDNFTLKAGHNRFKSIAHFKVPSQAGVERDSALRVLSNFICGQSTPGVRLRGQSRKATNLPYLLDGLTNLNVAVTLPGLPPSMKMIESALLLLHSPLATLSSLYAPSRLHLLNAFSVPLQVLKMKGSVIHNQAIIATIDLDLESSPILLKSNSTTWTKEVKLKLLVGVSTLMALVDFDLSQGVLKVDVVAVLDCKVGDYVVRGIEYSQTDVVSKIGLR